MNDLEALAKYTEILVKLSTGKCRLVWAIASMESLCYDLTSEQVELLNEVGLADFLAE